MLVATLPMYDWPEVRAVTDAFWTSLSNRMEVSLSLSRFADHTAAWRDPNLLFSQTCGYPFTHEFRNKLTYLATPCYAADGCEGSNYCSMVFARERQPLADFRGCRVAVNTLDSMSGMLATKLVFAPFAEKGVFFGSSLITGSHIASLAAVREGSADVCAIDVVAVSLARLYRPDYLAGLTEIARSPLVPALPYVTNAGDRQKLQAALQSCFADPDLTDVRKALCLSGVSILESKAYNRILDLENVMQAGGGLEL
jgi:ABC-type phosphate/phosphonate transport system substrate-binding protein